MPSFGAISGRVGELSGKWILVSYCLMSPRRERLSRSRYSVFHSSTLSVFGVVVGVPPVTGIASGELLGYRNNGDAWNRPNPLENDSDRKRHCRHQTRFFHVDGSMVPGNVRGAMFGHMHETPEQSYKKFEQGDCNRKAHARQRVKFFLAHLTPSPMGQDPKPGKIPGKH